MNACRIPITVCCALLLIGCSEGNAPAVNTRAVEPLSAGWHQFDGGADTICSDGTPYKYYARQGSSDQLVVYLEGGGACWFRDNCDPARSPTYNINLNQRTPPEQGIFDFSREDNPLRDASIVYAPYCSGDVHLGNTDTPYPDKDNPDDVLTIHHRGLANAQAALDFAKTQFAAPASVFVTGSSAGSIPSPYYAWRVAQMYPDARIVQLGDGSGGYRRTGDSALPHESWGTVAALKDDAPFAHLDDDTFNYEALYIATGKAAPDIQLAAYDAAEDAVQKSFLRLSGNQTASLVDLIRANQADVRAAVPGFRSFIAGGDSHTILGRSEFYTFKVGNTSFRDWLADLIAGRPVDNLSCADCLSPELVGPDMPPPLAALWRGWEDPAQQHVKAFQIFDNLYYVGINWVAAYVLKTSDGLILIDSLYGRWIPHIEQGMRSLGLNPADIRYVLLTHGHFDHAGGAAYFQRRYGAEVVMSEPDWALAAEPAAFTQFAFDMPVKSRAMQDLDSITLGDTTVTMLQTPGHTPGVFSYLYPVRDGEAIFKAITLGGVGLNFSGVEATEAYIASYERLIAETEGVSVSLPNHAAMGNVFERAARLVARESGTPHPFVDADGYQQSLATFLAAAREKLTAEQAGNAEDPLKVLSRTVSPD